MAIMELRSGEHPEQWMWMHRGWRWPRTRRRNSSRWPIRGDPCGLLVELPLAVERLDEGVDAREARPARAVVAVHEEDEIEFAGRAVLFTGEFPADLQRRQRVPSHDADQVEVDH